MKKAREIMIEDLKNIPKKLGSGGIPKKPTNFDMWKITRTRPYIIIFDNDDAIYAFKTEQEARNFANEVVFGVSDD